MYDLAPPPPPPPSSVTLPGDTRKTEKKIDNLLIRDEVWGWGRSQIMRRRESLDLYKHSILSGVNLGTLYHGKPANIQVSEICIHTEERMNVSVSYLPEVSDSDVLFISYLH